MPHEPKRPLPPKRQELPPGYVDAIGLDDDSIPANPYVLTPTRTDAIMIRRRRRVNPL